MSAGRRNLRLVLWAPLILFLIFLAMFASGLIKPTSRDDGMMPWRKRLFVALARNSASPVDYFKLPGDRTVSIGSQIEL